MTELLPCPFCGGEAIVTDCVYHLNLDDGSVYDKKGWTVGCRTVGCRGWFNRHINTEAEAIAAWNTRAERTCFADEVTHRDCKYSVNRGWRERTCHIIGEEYDDLLEYTSVEFSCGHYAIGLPSYFDYCPKCGSKVVEK